MAKRFIDTGFLDQKWIRKLTPEKKIFLIYLMLKCDNGGIIDLDIEDIEFWIGKKIGDLKFLPENYLIPLNETGKYFMPKFIEWQYKDLSSQKFIVVQARQILEKHNLINSDFTLNLDKSYVNVMRIVPNSQEQGNGIGNGIGNGNEDLRGEKIKNVFKKPTLSDVLSYFKESGYSEDAGKKAYNYYTVMNWVDSKGHEVKNWKGKMVSVWFKPENLDRSEPEMVAPELPEEKKEFLRSKGIKI